MKNNNYKRADFFNLKSGDYIYIKVGKQYFKSEVISQPFYNSDADEKGWEIETNNGFCDSCSAYIKIEE